MTEAGCDQLSANIAGAKLALLIFSCVEKTIDRPIRDAVEGGQECSDIMIMIMMIMIIFIIRNLP